MMKNNVVVKGGADILSKGQILTFVEHFHKNNVCAEATQIIFYSSPYFTLRFREYDIVTENRTKTEATKM